MMEMLRNAEFVRKLLGNGYKACIANLHAFGSVHTDSAFLEAMPPYQQYFALFPGASWDGKQWPVSHFRSLAERLHAATGWICVVCGGPDDRKIAAALCNGEAGWMLDWAVSHDSAATGSGPRRRAASGIERHLRGSRRGGGWHPRGVPAGRRPLRPLSAVSC